MWLYLLTLALLPDVVLVCLWWVHGSARWFLAGIIVSIGSWLAAGTVVVFSGAAPKWMGRMGEVWTADELRHAHKYGWRHINDTYLTDQIDHLAIGPAGLLVVETKWRSEPRPADERAAAQRIREQADKIELLLRNRHCLVPVAPVVVLWNPPTEKDRAPVGVTDGVTVVDGPDLWSWIRSLPAVEIDQEAADGAWELLTGLAEARDSYREARQGTAPRTATQLYWLGASYLFTGLASLLAACLAVELGGWKGLVAAGAAGLAAIPLARRPRLRPYVWTWTGSVTVLLFAVTVVFVVHRL